MAKILAMDLGGTGLKLGLFEGENLTRTSGGRHNYTSADLETVKKDISLRVDSFLSGDEVSAIGIGIAGLLSQDNALYRSTVFPSLIGFNLAEYLGGRFGVPASIDNDADCGALGEYYFKGGDFFYVVLGHGIGSAFVRKDGTLPYSVRFGQGTVFDEAKNPLPNDLGLRVLISRKEAYPFFERHGISKDSVDRALGKLISPDYPGNFRIGALGSPRALRNLLEVACGGDFYSEGNRDYYEGFLGEKGLEGIGVEDLMLPFDSAIPIARIAQEGEPNCLKAYRLMGEFLGYGILKAEEVIRKDYGLEPEARIAGPVMNDADLFLPSLKSYLSGHNKLYSAAPACSFMAGENPNLRGAFFKARQLID
ncbi:MAG: ROK family protein [Candidatus Aenigmarchaeota archaeon]|nr:ROK family protein [Candidatus Aenigmarchaeota archaeon]